MAEGTGFEPVIPFGIFAFQANALDRYANPPFGDFITYEKSIKFLLVTIVIPRS